jgi:hypothetical protein
MINLKPGKANAVVGAQIEINRLVWAMNLDLNKESEVHSFKNVTEAKDYMRGCAQRAIADLSVFLK